MPSAVEVVFQAQSEVVAQLMFDSEISLVGVGVLEVAGHREAIGQEGYGQAELQELLPYEYRGRIGSWVEALLRCQVIERGGAGAGSQDALEGIDGIEGRSQI